MTTDYTIPYRLLIYPYWNVNVDWLSEDFYAEAAFNLSILECKFVKRFQRLATLQLLIYPYWNVNL